MKADIETLKDTFKIGYEAFEPSRKEANDVWDLWHNRHYTVEQLATLQNRGQAAETFNIVKLFGRMLLGYYSTVVNEVKVAPVQYSDIPLASLLNDTIRYTLRDNQFESEGDKLKLDGIVAGLICCHVDVQDTENRDQFNRPIREIKINHVPANEVVLDPMSRLEDYSDARYMHRFKWVSEDHIIEMYGKDKLKELEAYYNHLNIDEAEFSFSFENGEFTGYYKLHDNYLVVHSVIVDDEGKTWNIHWSDEVELLREEITFKEVKWPYRVQKVHISDKTEYYGIFREVVETQKAINQAIIKVQLMINTQKAFVEDGAVKNLAEFTAQFNRVNAIIPVKDLNGIKVENLTREVIDQYTIIDKALDRVQRVLGINDSFLGMAYASDSGKKVQLQKQATILALRYMTGRFEQFYRLLGWDIVNLIKQYYTAHQAIRVADEANAQVWIELNKPIELQTGEVDPTTGEPITEYAYEEVLDPANGEPLEDEDGNLIMAPIPEQESEIAFAEVDITIETTNYNDEEEKNLALIDQVVNGQMGVAMMNVNPAGYFEMGAMSVKSLKLKKSPDIARILEQTSAMLQQQQAQPQQLPPQGGQPQ